MSRSVAIVTGGSRGIGAATACKLAKEGYAVAVNYHTGEEAAHAVVQEIVAGGGKAAAIQADMGKEQDILRLFAEAQKALGPLGALVNNAAINLRDGDGSVEQLSAASLTRMLAVNVEGVVVACREALKCMQERGGAIVNITSEAARFGGNRIAAYAATKAAVQTFTIGFAREAAGYGVRVNAVSPGVIATDAHLDTPPERRQVLQASIPLQRLGEPHEVAEVIAWLLSDKASYVTGAVIPVSGGR